MLKLLAFTLPLCLDTFAVSFAVLGEMHLTRSQRMRVIMLFIAFEAGMPLIGMAVGTPLMHLISGPPHLVFDPYQIGSAAEAYQLRMADSTHLADTADLTFVGRYIIPIIVPVVIGGLGLLMLDEGVFDDNDDDDDDEVGKARALVAARGLSVIGLGLGISLDELVVGFTLGFSKLPVRDVITAIVIQAFLAVMLGQFLGRKARTGGLRVSAQRITTGSKLAAGGVLVALAAVLLVGPPVATHLFPHFIQHKVAHYVAPPAVSTGQS
ncbi:MAG TPA: manganese efflux pump [Trebonia sp.]|jgi:putative Mn2+ efflux pump MntP|nr:manganese efflux pump [Trebonia sp.]